MNDLLKLVQTIGLEVKGGESKELEEGVDIVKPLWPWRGDSGMYHQAHHHGSFEC